MSNFEPVLLANIHREHSHTREDYEQTGGYQGVGFAVPTSMSKPVFESLVKHGKVVRGYLGIGIQDLNQDLTKSFGLKDSKGALVSDVKEDSPADKAGIKQGDVVTYVDG